MYYNRAKPIAVFLNEVHAQMYAKYITGTQVENVETMKDNAAQLQTFLQYIKKEVRKPPDERDLGLVSLLQDASLKGNQLKTLFGHGYSQTMATDPFEEELAGVIAAVTNAVSISEEDLGREAFIVGGDLASIANNMLDNASSKILGELSTGTSQKVQQRGSSPYTTVTARQGKIDVQGVNVEVNANANPYLIKMYELLKDATFSAKNYRGEYFNKSLMKSVPGSATLHLGSSNAYKAYYGVLSDLGASDSDIKNSFPRAYNSWKRYNTPEVGRYIYGIRQVYELIGAGLVYEGGKSLGNVKYLVYNEPDSDMIYVRSTAEIIQSFLQEGENPDNPFSRSVQLSKNFFHQ